jgi:hypothetical protein
VSYDDRLSDYNDVASRMREFFEKHPEGSLRPWNPDEPYQVVSIGDRTFIAYTAQARRTPDDPNPGIGTAWEPFPGRTPYTKDSELMNAETSAWGRAILAVGAADTRKGIASREEVRNRQADRDDATQQREQLRQTILTNAKKEIGQADSREGLEEIRDRIGRAVDHGAIVEQDAVDLRRLWVARLDELFPKAQDPPQESGVEGPYGEDLRPGAEAGT